MKLKTTTTYIAFDGKEFNTAEECKAYELDFERIATHIRAYDAEYNELTAEIPENNIDIVYLDVRDDKGVEIWNNTCNNGDKISRAGMYYFDFEEDEFIEINSKINELVEIMTKMHDLR